MEASPFRDLTLGSFSVSSAEQLFLIGGIAVAGGVYTYLGKVMMTVGDGLLTLSPLGAFVVLVSHLLVLFIFSSTALESLQAGWGLPTIPLLPVSGSQAVIGYVLLFVVQNVFDQQVFLPLEAMQSR